MRNPLTKEKGYNDRYFRRYLPYIKRDLNDISSFRIIKDLINKENCKILDIGSGIGYLLSWICENKNAYGIGVDISTPALISGKVFYPDLSFLKADSKELPLKKDTIDVVILNNVIEHLQEPEKTLIDIKRVLKKKGISIILTVDRKSLLKKIFVHDSTHTHEYSKDELIEFLDKFFKVTSIKKGISTVKFTGKINYFLGNYFPMDIIVKCEKQ